MKITMKEPNGPYSCELDTKVMEVEIRESFIGPTFITESGQTLCVLMRDDTFEFILNGKPVQVAFLQA